MHAPPPEPRPSGSGPLVETAPSPRGYPARRRRLAAWPAMAGGPLGALSPAATLAVGYAAGLWLTNDRRAVVGLTCVSVAVSFLLGWPAGAAAAIVVAKLPFFPREGRARELADFLAAFLGGTLLTLTVAGLAFLDEL